MTKRTCASTLSMLMSATAMSLVASILPGQVLDKDVQPNAATVTAPPAGGFSIRLNGDPVTSDTAVTNIARQVDVALEDADIQVVFDGLGAEPRLDLEIIGDDNGAAVGDTIQLQSALNYPAYIARAEFRLIDRAAIGGPRTVGVVPVAPNGVASVVVPEGDIVVVHRVYDANGRFDETLQLVLAEADNRPLIDRVEDGSDFTSRRRIPVHGGAVTVNGTGVASGARVRVLGEPVTPDPNGGFVLQRILPSGTYDVDVAVNGSRQNVNLTRRVTIPASEWFTTGTVDLTYRINDNEIDGQTEVTTGRVAGYIDGRTEDGIEVAASIDTGEGDLGDIFRDLDEKDPRQLLLRVDPDDLYPTYGDDSTLVDNTPTSGKLYLRVAKEGNFLVWGDFDASLGGSALVRNERSLYGLQVHAETRDTTSKGDARASLDLFAAQPERLPQRDVFLGTGGSVYFLDKQDIGAASETVSIQLRDPTTGRVIETIPLTVGEDYDINYIQGIVTLARPLQSAVQGATLITEPGASTQAQLVVQYEFTPTAEDVDGYSFGGRAEAWASDNLRFGVSGLTEQTGIADQRLVGVDVRLQYSEGTYLQFDYAESDGPGFGSTFSADGGLIVETVAGGSGSGRALKAEGKADFADLGFGIEGAIAGYFEDREEGFSNLNDTVTATTGDETLWGIAADVQPRDGLRVSFYYDAYENDVGEFDRKGGLEIGADLSEFWTLDIGLENVDRNRGSDTGGRTDLAARLTYGLSDETELYVFAQATLEADGLDENNRAGVGGSYEVANGWRLEGEVSDGSLGLGARAFATREDAQGNTLYFGYALEPGREVDGQTLNGRDRGQFVTGGERRVGTDTTVFGENTYDMFGQRRSLTSAYGLTYEPTDALSYVVALEFGRVEDGADTDFDRTAVSFGAQYEDEMLQASGRIEYRVEDGLRDGSDVESDTLLLSASGRYKLSDSARIVGGFEHAKTDTDQGSLLDGEYTNATIGYAYRPVENDRLNLLARYRYLNDQIGQRVDGTDEDGPRQRSHVFSVDGLYEVSERWTVGAKFGYRSSETAATDADSFSKNDAWLAAANATYHVVAEWDALLEVRNLTTVQADTSDIGVLAAGYRHFGENLKVGVGYNFGRFSDDLTDLVQDDEGIFINLIAKF